MKLFSILVATIVATLTGCSLAWAEPADYSYRVQYTVFGPGAGTYDVTVRDHIVAVVEPVASDDPGGETGSLRAHDAWTLADLIARADQANASADPRASVTYDSETGVRCWSRSTGWSSARADTLSMSRAFIDGKGGTTTFFLNFNSSSTRTSRGDDLAHPEPWRHSRVLGLSVDHNASRCGHGQSA